MFLRAHFLLCLPLTTLQLLLLLCLAAHHVAATRRYALAAAAAAAAAAGHRFFVFIAALRYCRCVRAACCICCALRCYYSCCCVCCCCTTTIANHPTRSPTPPRSVFRCEQTRLPSNLRLHQKGNENIEIAEVAANRKLLLSPSRQQQWKSNVSPKPANALTLRPPSCCPKHSKPETPSRAYSLWLR